MITACKNTKFTCYTEEHHIIPLSIGGTDSKDNLVELSARHHYIAHLLLTKIYENEPVKYRSLLYAVMCMRYGRVNNERSFKYNSRLYAIKREKFAKMRSEQMKTDNPTLGKVFIMDIKNEVNMCINKSDPLPNGFVYGKCMNFKSLKDKIRENDLTIDEFI